jgi:tetratricopeptide (TPR) repeat protein
VADFFVSYNKADRAWAEWIAWELEEAGFSTLVQAWDFRGNWVLAMERAMKETVSTVAVLSPDYLEARFVQPEYAEALRRDPTGWDDRLIPIRVRECQPDGWLAQIVYTDLVGLDEAEARKLLIAPAKGERLKPERPPHFPGQVRHSAASPEKPDKPPEFPGTPRPAPRVWNVPHGRNPNFTGREWLLEELHRRLSAGETAALVQTIHGLGGIGKTTLAAEYAHRHRGDYDVVWWVRAEEPAALAADYAALGGRLGIVDEAERDLPKAVEAVRGWLDGHDGCLLVFDNATEPKDLRLYLPPGGGRIVVTSRNPVWGAVAKPLRVEVMTEAEAVAFLLRQSGPGEEGAARELAAEVGYLPLALEQARAYVEEKGITLGGYLDRFRRYRADLLAQRPESGEYPLAVAATWEAAFEAAREREPAAAELMNLCAFLAPDAIPLDLIRAGAAHLPEALATAAASPLRLDQAVAALRRYSLVEAADGALSFHRLVQAVARDRMGDAERRRWAGIAVNVVEAGLPDEIHDIRWWPAARLLLPHGLAAAEHAEQLDVEGAVVAGVLGKLGMYLWARAELAAARRTLERALRIKEAAHGPDHREVAPTLGNLGTVLQDMGELPAARVALERALRLFEAAHGPDHPEVARALINLAIVLRQLGESAAAQEKLERALRINEAVHGPDHPEVARALTNLGAVLQDMGELPAARAALERALRINEAAHGPDHPEVARALTNLGAVLQDMGELLAARAALERALRLFEAAHGPDHPEAARTLTNLGNLLRQLGESAAAREKLERALRIKEAAYGPDHPEVAPTLTNLAIVLRQLGESGAAREKLERALRIKEGVHGPDHPEVALALARLGILLRDAGERDAARRAAERAATILTASLGREHPHTRTVQRFVESLSGRK